MHSHEAEVWGLLAAVEGHTGQRYRAHAPELWTPEKDALLSRLEALRQDADVLAGTPLADVLPPLLVAAEGQGGPQDVLWIQGLLLERVGVTLYRALQESGRLSQEGEEVAALAVLASSNAADQAAQRLLSLGATGEENFAAFASCSTPVLQQLDQLGEALDARFGGPLNLLFSDVMGETVAELLPVCAELGLARRKVMVHLTSALMA